MITADAGQDISSNPTSSQRPKRRASYSAISTFDDDENNPLLRLALRNSLLLPQSAHSASVTIQDAPTFFPSVVEFENPLSYIER